MASQYSFGKVVTKGLVLCLDAGDKNSYPGSGTTWFDLSGKRNHGTLINGPTFSSTNGGGIVFDGTNDYINITNNLVYNTAGSKAVEVWANVGSTTGKFTIITTNRANTDTLVNFAIMMDDRQVIRSWNPSGADRMILMYSIGNGTTSFFAYSKNKCGTTDGDNAWHHIVGVTDMFTNQIILYYDGTAVHSQSITGTPSTPAAPLRIGAGYTINASDNPFTGKVASYKIYNRALSAAEILQNYNAQKSRFGLN